MRRLINNDNANLDMILGAVSVSILLAVSIVVAWNVVGGIDTADLDTIIRQNVHGLQQSNPTDAENATWNATLSVGNSTDSLADNMETFYAVAPIVLIVMAAIAILGYVMLLRRT
jgi:hypothetical protein